MKAKQLLYAAGCIALCELAGIIGSVFTYQSVQMWYPTLTKPFFTPPSWIFGPVWTLLYAFMGISLYLVLQKKKRKLTWFWIQLVLNVVWSIVFFGLRSPEFGLFVIGGLLFSIIMTIRSFKKVEKRAAYLLYPYVAWVSFATLLNFAIVILN